MPQERHLWNSLIRYDAYPAHSHQICYSLMTSTCLIATGNLSPSLTACTILVQYSWNATGIVSCTNMWWPNPPLTKRHTNHPGLSILQWWRGGNRPLTPHTLWSLLPRWCQTVHKSWRDWRYLSTPRWPWHSRWMGWHLATHLVNNNP